MKYKISIEGWLEIDAENDQEAIGEAFKQIRECSGRLQDASIPYFGVYALEEDGKWRLRK